MRGSLCPSYRTGIRTSLFFSDLPNCSQTTPACIWLAWKRKKPRHRTHTHLGEAIFHSGGFRFLRRPFCRRDQRHRAGRQRGDDRSGAACRSFSSALPLSRAHKIGQCRRNSHALAREVDCCLFELVLENQSRADSAQHQERCTNCHIFRVNSRIGAGPYPAQCSDESQP